MDRDFVKRIAEGNFISESGVLFGVCTKQIRWDNCENRIVTMANVGQVVYLTRSGDGGLSAHFEYGDHIISDYLGVDESVRVVSEKEADAEHAEYRKKMRERMERNREAREFELDSYNYDYDDSEVD